jgi:hypothetical protein
MAVDLHEIAKWPSGAPMNVAVTKRWLAAVYRELTNPTLRPVDRSTLSDATAPLFKLHRE